MAAKKKSKKKLTKISTIHRRLFRFASIECREKSNFTCEMCGMKKGDLYKGKPQRVECHHMMSRNNTNSPLKFDPRNLICLCTLCHKGGKRSAHKHGLWFADQVKQKRPDDYKWVLEHTDDMVDLKNREILAFIEECLKYHKQMDFEPEQYINDTVNNLKEIL